MINARKLVDYISAEPFRPFRLNMASGQKFEVRHPENIAIRKTTARVFSPVVESSWDEQWHDISLVLIESVEPMESRSAWDRN